MLTRTVVLKSINQYSNFRGVPLMSLTYLTLIGVPSSNVDQDMLKDFLFLVQAMQDRLQVLLVMSSTLHKVKLWTCAESFGKRKVLCKTSRARARYIYAGGSAAIHPQDHALRFTHLKW